MSHHVVLEGNNRFQKEQEMEFPDHVPPPTIYIREYAALTLKPISMFEPLGQNVQVKERRFRLRSRLYALGKDIAYYTEEC